MKTGEKKPAKSDDEETIMINKRRTCK